MQTTEPRFGLNRIVKGRHYGTFVTFGRRWAESLGEWIYEVRQLDDNGELIPGPMSLAESCFAEGC